MDIIVGNDNCSFVDVCNALRGTVCFTEKLIEVALELGVPSDVVHKLRTGLNTNTYGHYDALHKILESWRSKESDNARLTVLIGVLEACGDSEAADELRARFTPPRDLIVGDEPCTFREVCNVLMRSRSTDLLMRSIFEIGVGLQVSSDVLQQVKVCVSTQSMTFYEAMFEILTNWRAKSADDARLSLLLNVLEDHGIRSVADELRARFNAMSDGNSVVNPETVLEPGPISSAEEIVPENKSPAPTGTNVGNVTLSQSAVIAEPVLEQDPNNSAERCENKGKIVGKITVFESESIAHGKPGTHVYNGKFGGWDVAVKRILVEEISIVQREINHLEESFRHPNIVRLFGTENNGPFQYIALELCVGTLTNWIEKTPGAIPIDWSVVSIGRIRVLKEATEGLAYLHSLRIVHRDVKPANILLAHGIGSGSFRAVIADFGLCKKLHGDTVNFTRSSGGTPGTDGYTAPEIINWSGNIEDIEHMTNSVDVFSLGCVYYYVLTRGQHPFGGDRLVRQSNIQNNTYNLNAIESHPLGAHGLVRIMISHDHSARPPLSAVLKHPIFWSKDKVLRFLGKVSNSMEGEDHASFPLLKKLEEKAGPVVKTDWWGNICVPVQNELKNRKHPYDGKSIQQLIRAIRNKDNHFKTLKPDAAAVLLPIPDKFIPYWTEKFPLLVSYIWAGFEELQGESIFSKYYDPKFKFWGPLVTDCQFIEVCNVLRTSASYPDIVEKLFEIAIQLEVGAEDVYDFKRKLNSGESTSVEILHEILQAWRSRVSVHARLSVLISVLEDLGLSEAAVDLRARFPPPRDLIVGDERNTRPPA